MHTHIDTIPNTYNPKRKHAMGCSSGPHLLNPIPFPTQCIVRKKRCVFLHSRCVFLHGRITSARREVAPVRDIAEGRTNFWARQARAPPVRSISPCCTQQRATQHQLATKLHSAPNTHPKTARVRGCIVPTPPPPAALRWRGIANTGHVPRKPARSMCREPTPINPPVRV